MISSENAITCQKTREKKTQKAQWGITQTFDMQSFATIFKTLYLKCLQQYLKLSTWDICNNV